MGNFPYPVSGIQTSQYGPFKTIDPPSELMCFPQLLMLPIINAINKGTDMVITSFLVLLPHNSP